MILEKRPTQALIYRQRLLENLRQLSGILPAGQKMMGIVKANGYGLGAVEVSQTLASHGVDLFGVATFEEALSLRESGLKENIFVLNGIMGPLAEYRQKAFIPVLHQHEELSLVVNESKHSPLPFALKFDTGMGRLGFPHTDANSVSETITAAKISPVGVFTHLARADENMAFTEEPYRRFHAIRKTFRDQGHQKTRFSICNSASVLDRHFDDFDWVRPGIALYGAYPHPRQKEALPLQPVLELKTRIIELKNLTTGSPVGYGATFVTTRPSKIALLPIGYADGYPRLISNRGSVIVRGVRAPIVGRISMDLMAIDVTDISGASVYDEATLIGRDGATEIRVEEVAAWADTISYEILTGLMPRVHKKYI